jgi:guanylate kinase
MSSNQKILIFSAPSGAGKTTLVQHCLGLFPQLQFSISCTTRPPRGQEKDGQDYYFLSPQDFKQKINDGLFLEYEEVYTDKFYGTLNAELERIWAQNAVVIFDVDVVGALNIKQKFGQQALAVFIAPPNVAALKSRLEGRATDSPELIATRLAKAEEELSYAPQFDVTVVNDNLDEAKRQIVQIIGDFLQN